MLNEATHKNSNMKIKFTFLIIVIVMLLFSCLSPVKKADKIISEQADTAIGEGLVFITSTMEFYYYANPNNYWYSDEYTFRDIVDDKYQKGYRGLKKLEESINAIHTDDLVVQDAIKELATEIKNAKSDVRKKQNALENLNGIFGLLTFGGSSGILDIDNALSTPAERDSVEKKRTEMPESVKIAFDYLVNLISYKYNVITSNINTFEDRTFKLSDPDNEEKSQIRNNLKLYVKNKISQQYNSKDTICRDKILEDLFSLYDQDFPLNFNNMQ